MECNRWPAGETVEREITLSYLNQIANTLEADIINEGWCFKVIKDRIYGSMQMSEDLMTYGPSWVTHWRDIASDETVRSGSGGSKRQKNNST